MRHLFLRKSAKEESDTLEKSNSVTSDVTWRMNGKTRVSCQQGFTDGEIEKSLRPWGDNERDSTAENTATAHSIVCTRVLSLLLLPCSLSTLPQ